MRDPEEVVSQIRNALERENQAYTFIAGRFVDRMTAQEVESVETALQTPIEAAQAELPLLLLCLFSGIEFCLIILLDLSGKLSPPKNRQALFNAFQGLSSGPLPV